MNQFGVEDLVIDFSVSNLDCWHSFCGIFRELHCEVEVDQSVVPEDFVAAVEDGAHMVSTLVAFLQ